MMQTKEAKLEIAANKVRHEFATQRAKKGLEATRSAIDTLLILAKQTNDEYALGKLGGILADLKLAQNELETLNTGN